MNVLMGVKEYFGFSSPAPKAVGTGFVQGNELTLFEKRMAPLQYSEPYFLQKGLSDKRVLKEPLRFSEHMTEIRSDEVTAYGKRRLKDTRKMKHEFADRIKGVVDRQKREEEEARKNKRDKRARWWHRTRDPDQKDPLKYLRYSNLTLVPESLLMTKDVVILQLTGARLGDEAMTWVGAFLQQSFTVKRLILQGNYITDQGVEHIGLGLRSSKSLMELDISLNPIGDVGVELIVTALQENNKYSRLYLLNVSSCDLSSASGFHLARFVREFKHLQCLLAWRNRLGVSDGAPISGAGLILDEVRNAPHMRLLNLTANNITEKEASDHASALERATRRQTLTALEKAQRARKIEELQRDIEDRKKKFSGKAGRATQEERLIVHRIERMIDQEKSKIELQIKIEERQRTYVQRQEKEFHDRVLRLTGQEIVSKKHPCRLILTGNNITETTIHRLGHYYSVAEVPNIDEFLTRKRRFDNVVAPRRKIGEEYQTRDENILDTHSIMPWDAAFDGQVDYERRQALIQWKEDERIRDEELVLADFNKFKMNDVRHLAPEDRAKASAGFGLASGVNARIRVVRDAAKAAEEKIKNEKIEEERISRIRASYGLRADGSPVASPTSTRPAYVPKRITDEATIDMGHDPATRKEPVALVITGEEESALIKEESAVPLTNEVTIDATTGQHWQEVEMDEATLMQHKMQERMNELRAHMEQKMLLAHQEITAMQLAHDTSMATAAAAAADPNQNNADGANVHKSLSSTPSIDGATPDSDLDLIVKSMKAVIEQWEVVRELGEKGSPSDEDLQKLELAKTSLTNKKDMVVRFIRASKDVESSRKVVIPQEGEVIHFIEQFFEDLVKETDLPPGNTDLVATMMDHLDIDFPQLFATRGLVAMAASDGSESYFTKFLSLPNHQYDISEVCCACFYNQSTRIPLTFIAIQFLDLQAYADEIGDMLREFFADIASEKRAIPKENRVLKLMLLRTLLHMSWLNVDVEAEGPDGQTIFTRALYEGDVEVVELILEDPSRIKNINMVKTDGSTPLMQAVMGNKVKVVSLLFEHFPNIDVSIRGENGNAMDLAMGLSRDRQIVLCLREHGAQSSGVKVDKAELAEATAPKKIRMKVKVGEGHQSPSRPSSAAATEL